MLPDWWKVSRLALAAACADQSPIVPEQRLRSSPALRAQLLPHATHPEPALNCGFCQEVSPRRCPNSCSPDGSYKINQRFAAKLPLCPDASCGFHMTPMSVDAKPRKLCGSTGDRVSFFTKYTFGNINMLSPSLVAARTFCNAVYKGHVMLTMGSNQEAKFDNWSQVRQSGFISNLPMFFRRLFFC